MAMRPCIHCGADISYDRDLKDIVTGNKVGFWRDFTNNQMCSESPNGLHDPGDVATPPADVDGIEAYLEGTYVPKKPSEVCGSPVGLDEQGEFLVCTLDKDHDGGCEAQAAAQLGPAPDPNAPAPEVPEGPMMIGVSKEYDENSKTWQITVALADESAILGIGFKEDTPPDAIIALLHTLSQATHTTYREMARKAKDESAPPLMEDVTDIEKFLRGEE